MERKNAGFTIKSTKVQNYNNNISLWYRSEKRHTVTESSLQMPLTISFL